MYFYGVKLLFVILELKYFEYNRICIRLYNEFFSDKKTKRWKVLKTFES